MSLPLGTVVWAKLGSYQHWPGRVSQLSDIPKNVRSQLKTEDGNEIIYFFASKNYAVVPDKAIERWEEGYKTRSLVKKGGKSFQTAIKEAEYWIKHNKSMSSDAESEDEEEEEEGEQEEEKSSPRKKSRKESKEEGKSDDEKKNGEKQKKKETPRSKSAEKEKKKEKEKRRHTEDHKKRRGKESGSDDENHERKKRSHRDAEDNRKPKRDSEDAKREGSPEKRRKTEEEGSEQSPNGDRKKLGNPQIQKVAAQICKHPVAKYFKYAHEEIGEGSASAKATFSSNRPDIQAEVHPSIASLHYLMDITVYLACLSQLQDMQDAQTMDWKVTVFGQIPKGGEVTLKANIVQNQTTLLFVECEALCKGKLVAKGTAVKNIINLTVPLTNESQGSKKKEEAQ